MLLIPGLAAANAIRAAAAPELLSPRPYGLGVPGLQVEALGSIQSPLCVDHKPTACELGKDASLGCAVCVESCSVSGAPRMSLECPSRYGIQCCG